MLLPQIEMTINAQNGTSCTKMVPRHRVACYKALWSIERRLKDGDEGIQVRELPDDCPDNIRYLNIQSFDEERRVCAAVCGEALFVKLYPTDEIFEATIRKELNADATRAVARSKKLKEYKAVEALQNFLDVGLPPENAVNLHRLGIVVLGDIPLDVLDLSSKANVTPGMALSVIEAIQARPGAAPDPTPKEKVTRKPRTAKADAVLPTPEPVASFE